jgi:hypothetical protein
MRAFEDPRITPFALGVPSRGAPFLFAVDWRCPRQLIARFDFACLVAELVDMPGADQHFDPGYYLFVGRAHCASVFLPKAHFALKLDE